MIITLHSTNKVRLIIIFFIGIFILHSKTNVIGQNTVVQSDKQLIVNNLMKRFFIATAFSHAEFEEDFHKGDYKGRYFSLFNLGFIHADISDYFVIEPFTNLDYLAKDEQLYKIFLKKILVDSISDYYNSTGFFNPSKFAIVSMGSNKTIKCLSGCTINDSFINCMELEPKKPKSYLKYLKLKLLSHEYESIKFKKKKGDTLYFIVKYSNQNMHSFFELRLKTSAPDKMDMKFLMSKKRKGKADAEKKAIVQNTIKKIPLRKASFEVKRAFLLNEFMKNFYSYKITHQKDIIEKLSLDTAAWVFTKHTPYLDSIIPNYFEAIENIDVITVPDREIKCYVGKKIVHNPFGNDREILGTSVLEGYELYRIWKDTATILRDYRHPNAIIDLDCRYDYYYLPTIKKETIDFLAACKMCPPISPNCYTSVPYISLDKSDCLPYNIWEGWEEEKNMDYYLVAINVYTNNITFVSGKDITLNNTYHLYSEKPFLGVESELNPIIVDMNVYIKDKLYRYQVKDVSGKNIVKSDDKVTVYHLKGKERGKEVNIEVVLPKAKPELIQIRLF